jgi:hypothetical protein
MLNAKVKSQRAGASAMPEIKGRRGNIGGCAGMASGQKNRAAGGEMEQLPESVCDFVLDDVDGELVIGRECPEKEERLKAKC